MFIIALVKLLVLACMGMHGPADLGSQVPFSVTSTLLDSETVTERGFGGVLDLF